MASGGAEKVISLFLTELVKDFNVTLFLFYNEKHFRIPKEVKTVTFSNGTPKVSSFRRILDFILFTYMYNRLLHKNKIEYGISFLAFPNLINGIASIFNPNLKTIISERGYPSDNTSSKLSLYISKLFYPLLYNRCDKLFSNSVYINKDLKENFGVKIPMRVIYNPIQSPRDTIDSRNIIEDKEIFNLINVGSLNKRKNQFMIIKALSQLEAKYKLAILGDGEAKSSLEKLILSNGLNQNVSLIGKVKNVNDFLIQNDCFILSSNTEGFPNALLEAMAIGLPCISTNCLSGPLELLNDNDSVNIAKGDFFKASYGILVNMNDDIGLANALCYLKSNPTERKRYSELSIERSKKYMLKNIYIEFRDFITH